MLKARVYKNLTLLIVLLCVGLLNTNCSKIKSIFSKKTPKVNIQPLNAAGDEINLDDSMLAGGGDITDYTETADGFVVGMDDSSNPYDLDNGERTVNRQDVAGLIVDLETIHFDFNSATIPQSALAMLEHHARWLKDHSDIIIQIEGHCDERGTIEYNLNLGRIAPMWFANISFKTESTPNAFML